MRDGILGNRIQDRIAYLGNIQIKTVQQSSVPHNQELWRLSISYLHHIKLSKNDILYIIFMKRYLNNKPGTSFSRDVQYYTLTNSPKTRESRMSLH